MLYKKAIGPVIATALLLVVTIIAIIGFQSWNENFSSSIFISVEEKSSMKSLESGIETIMGNTLYFKNNYDENLTIKSIKIGNNLCDNVSNISSGIKSIDISSCISDLSSSDNLVIIITNKGIFSKEIYFENINPTTLSPISYECNNTMNISTLVTINSSNSNDCINVLSGGTLSINSSNFSILGDINILSGGILTHPLSNLDSKDYFLNISANNFNLESGSSINLNGKGYSGGTNSHKNGYGLGGGIAQLGAGNYGGAGAGHGNIGGEGQGTSNNGGPIYSNTLFPFDLGSGGAVATLNSNAWGLGGSGGGLLILTINNNLNISGNINVDGTDGTNNGNLGGGGGSGGSIYINTKNFYGNGLITANGGNGFVTTYVGGGGAGGIITIYSKNNYFLGSIQNHGGTGSQSGNIGSTINIFGNNLNNLDLLSGVISLSGNYNNINLKPSTQLDINSNLNLNSLNMSSSIVNNNGIFTLNNIFGNDSNFYNDNSLTISNFNISNYNFFQNGTLSVTNNILTIGQNGIFNIKTNFFEFNGNINILSGGILTQYYSNLDIKDHFLNITANNLNLESGSLINLTGKGYSGGINSHLDGYGPGAAIAQTDAGFSGGAGAGHGNIGGEGQTTPSNAGSAYSNSFLPFELGSGGAIGTQNSAPWGLGGSGGGLLILNINNNLSINGTINVNGNDGTNVGNIGGGGGSGGSIYINTNNLNGNGLISANGGTGFNANYDGGGGSGGRIAVYNSSSSFTGLITVNGGTGYQSGSVGTIYFD